MSLRFVPEFAPQRVCFGSGDAAETLAREVGALPAARVMLIAARPEAELAAIDAPRALRDYGLAEAEIPAAGADPAGLADDVSDDPSDEESG